VIGDNGAGKSSLLEVIRLFGRAKLTPGQAREAGRFGAASWACRAAWIDSPTADGLTLLQEAELRWSKGLAIEVNHRAASAAELAHRFLVGPVDCSVQRIIAEGPALRRQFVDWALFHVEPNFHALWSVWRRQLSQRNRLLMQQADLSQVRAWNEGLISNAEKLTASRLAFIDRLRPLFLRQLANLLGVDNTGESVPVASLELFQGWTADLSYADVLVRGEVRDLSRRLTVDGPQRADLKIEVAGAPARLLSRGQQKLLFAALMLAGCRVIAEQRGSSPVILVDDFDAELAAPARLRLRDALLQYPGQVVVTQHTAEPGFWPENDHRMFHVEHGHFIYGVE
jgi:DNA replication and repair protein RecF